MYHKSLIVLLESLAPFIRFIHCFCCTRITQMPFYKFNTYDTHIFAFHTSPKHNITPTKSAKKSHFMRFFWNSIWITRQLFAIVLVRKSTLEINVRIRNSHLLKCSITPPCQQRKKEEKSVTIVVQQLYHYFKNSNIRMNLILIWMPLIFVIGASLSSLQRICQSLSLNHLN